MTKTKQFQLVKPTSGSKKAQIWDIMQINKLDPTEKEELNSRRIVDFWLIVTSIKTIKHSLQELIDNKLIRQKRKSDLVRLKNTLVRWQQQGMRGSSAEERAFLEGSGEDNMYMLQEIMQHVFVLPPDQIDWFSDIIAVLVRSAMNNSPEVPESDKVKVKPEHYARMMASATSLSEEGREWLANETEKLIFAAHNKFSK